MRPTKALPESFPYSHIKLSFVFTVRDAVYAPEKDQIKYFV